MFNEIVDIMPALAIPTSTSTNAVCLSSGPKWLFTGGDDGFIRKFNLISSLKGEAPLTVAQRHQIVDSIDLGAVVDGYWENEVPQRQLEAANDSLGDGKKVSTGVLYTPTTSPVYSLAGDKQGFWLLSGLNNGGISLQSSRMNEGSIQWYFRDNKSLTGDIGNGGLSNWRGYQGDAHSEAVSCLALERDQRSFLSGSWDRKCLYWDLDTGKVKGRYLTKGQVSSIEWRPEGLENVEIEASSDPVTIPTKKEEANEDDMDMDSLFGSDDEDKTPTTTATTTTTTNSIKENKVIESSTTFLTSTINGALNIWDTRVSSGANSSAGSNCVTNIAEQGEPWCMSATWSEDGHSIFAGRRRGVVEQWDIRKPSSEALRTLKLPLASGSISAVTRVNTRYLLLGGNDNVRLYDMTITDSKRVPFLTVPSHGGGLISSLKLDATGRFLVCACGGRGWGRGGDHVFFYELLGPRSLGR